MHTTYMQYVLQIPMCETFQEIMQFRQSVGLNKECTETTEQRMNKELKKRSELNKECTEFKGKQ